MPRFQANIKPARYDWDAAWVLYVAGATLEEVSEACKIDYGDLIKHSAKKAWAANRAAAHKLANQNVKNNPATRIERLRIKHQNFVLDQVEEIESEIEQVGIGEKDPDDPEGKAKMTIGKKISLTQRVHDLASPVLGLDKEQEKIDPVQAGFAMLVAMGRGMQQGTVLVNEKPLLPAPVEGVIEGEITSMPQPETPETGENKEG